MNMATKKNIFEEHFSAWLKTRGKRKERGKITEHICFVTGMHRNSVPRKFKALQMRDPYKEEKRGRQIYYTPDVTAALREIWEVSDEACGELLHPQIKEYIEILDRDGFWEHSNEATAKLKAMSEHTVRRRIAGFERMRSAKKGLSSTKPSALKSIIPIFKGPWKNLPPGHEQIDTVAHCGDTLLGDFIYTVSAIDAAAYWINARAQWNKGQEATVSGLTSINDALPFPWIEAHPDTGSEFINWHCKKWCDTKKIIMSRSEPSKKNDNMYVEERNGHVVRRYLGYRRFDCPKVVPLMNDFYRVLGLYLNHFKAVRRQISKERVGSKYVRKYEKIAKTPYQRVLQHPAIDESVKEKLRKEHAALNPLILKREMNTQLEVIKKQQTRHDRRNCGCSFR
jgi:hypothetical protein